jgi:hypothetical protein
MRRIPVLALLLLVACVGTPGLDPTHAPTTPPPPPIPRFADLRSQDCFPRSARTRGVPGFVPVPTTAGLQGPDDYAGPYVPLGPTEQRIAGRGFAYLVSSRGALVAGFYSACLEAYATEIEWKGPLPAGEDDALFRIPQPGRDDVIVLIAEDPEGPTAVVIFTDYRISEVPSPLPSPSPSASGPGSGSPPASPSPGA